MKKVISFALILTLLLSACGSAPTESAPEDQLVEQTIEEPNDTSSIDQEQAKNTTEKSEQSSSVADETIELQIPCFYNLALTFLPSDIIDSLEEYGASNFKKNADASLTCKISKSEFDKYIADSVSNYNEFVQGQEGYPVKELIFDKDYKQATFQGDPSDEFYQCAASDALIPYLLSTLVYGPDSTIDLSAPNAEDPSKLNTISYPPESLPFNSIVGVNLDDIDVLVTNGYTETNYAGETCLSVEYVLINNSSENKNFETCVMDQAFQNGVELDSSIISLDDDFDTALKDVQPGYSITVKQSYVLPNTTDPVTVEVVGFLSDSPNKASKTFTLTQE